MTPIRTVITNLDMKLTRVVNLIATRSLSQISLEVNRNQKVNRKKNMIRMTLLTFLTARSTMLIIAIIAIRPRMTKIVINLIMITVMKITTKKIAMKK